MQHQLAQTEAHLIEAIFWRCCGERFQTRLEGGAAEPEYLPHDARDGIALIRYRADYVASAFHELAHWCVAGLRRRQLVDYGYWYAADGRNAHQQARFCAVESKPQAIESLFHDAWGSTFHPSADNLDGEAIDPRPFLQAIAEHRIHFERHGLPPRAARLVEALKVARRSSCPVS